MDLRRLCQGCRQVMCKLFFPYFTTKKTWDPYLTHYILCPGPLIVFIVTFQPNTSNNRLCPEPLIAFTGTFQPDTSNLTNLSPFVRDDQSVANSFRLACAATEIQKCNSIFSALLCLRCLLTIEEM